LDQREARQPGRRGRIVDVLLQNPDLGIDSLLIPRAIRLEDIDRRRNGFPFGQVHIGELEDAARRESDGHDE